MPDRLSIASPDDRASDLDAALEQSTQKGSAPGAASSVRLRSSGSVPAERWLLERHLVVRDFGIVTLDQHLPFLVQKRLFGDGLQDVL